MRILGSGNDASAANRTVSVCLSTHVYTGQCETGSFNVVLPQNTASVVVYPAAATPDSLMVSWLDASHQTPLSMLNVSPKSFNVTINGSAVNWSSGVGGNYYPNNYFGEHWQAGDHITIPGSAPTCPANDCTIAAVQSALQLTIVQNLGNFNGGKAVTAVADNFGAIIAKTTGIGSISIDRVSNMQSDEGSYTNVSSGQTYWFSNTQVSVCVDRNGNPINPCRNAYSLMAPAADNTNVWMLFFPDNGESRFLDPLRPPDTGGVDGYSNVYCSTGSAAFNATDASTAYCAGIDSTRQNEAIVTGHYVYNASNGCDYRHWNGYYANPNGNPCVVWTNVTPISQGKGMTAAIQKVWPTYDPAYDGGLNFCQFSQDGTTMAFKTVQGGGAGTNPANHFGAEIIYDPVQEKVVQWFTTYLGPYPARYGQLHGCGGEYFRGFNGTFMGTYNYYGPRGAADYTLPLTSIGGRTDLSLDPEIAIASATTDMPMLVTTAVPHQIDPNGNTLLIINSNPINGVFGLYYAKVVNATQFQLYNDAAYTQPVQFTPHTQPFQQGITSTSNLVGGTGCNAGSFTVGPISDEGGSGATLNVTASGGRVTGVSISNQGSGYQSNVFVRLTGRSCAGASVVLVPQSWHMHTFYANACPVVSAQWQALGVTPGAPNCITLNSASDPVHFLPDSLNSSSSGVHNVVIAGGGSYTSPPAVTFSGGGGSGASGTAVLTNGAVSGVTIASHGTGYSYPRVVLSGGGGYGANGSVLLSGASVASVGLDNGGSGYKTAPNVAVVGGGGSGAVVTAVLSATGSILALNVTGGGSGYLEQPVITVSGGTGAAFTANINSGVIGSITVNSGGAGYSASSTVSITGGYGSGATATATVGYSVASFTVTAVGSGYSLPTVTFTGGGGAGASATVGLYEEVSSYPYPHNAASCGGDGTTAFCRSQPLTLQEGDAFTFIGESSGQERPFAVKVTHNSDGTVTGVFARFVGACSQQIPISNSNTAYSHITPVRPTMVPGASCNGLGVYYAQSDAALSNPLEENAAWGSHGDFMTPNSSNALAVRLQNDGNNQAFRFGPPAFEIGLSPQFSSANPPAFGKSTAHFNPALVQTHPSSRQYQATSNELRWYLDTRVISNEFGGVSNVFQNTVTQVPGSCAGSTCIYDVTNPFGFDIKQVPLAAWAGNNLLQDKSGPGSVLSSPGDVWKYCYAYNAGECVSGSPARHAYMVVDKAVANGQCGGYYNFNVPCLAPANPELQYNVQVGMDPNKPDILGTNWRRLTMAFGGWGRNIDGFSNARATPDGSWALVMGHWLDGLHCDLLAVKLPPWPGQESAYDGDFVDIPVPIPPSAGTVNARIRFGYAENGPANSFFCTTRQEACTTSGSPFAFASETQTDTACANGCTIEIPAMPRRVVYYEIDLLDGSGNVIFSSPLHVDSGDEQAQARRRKMLGIPGKPRKPPVKKGTAPPSGAKRK